MLCFLEMIYLLVEEKHILPAILDTLNEGWSPLPDVTIQEMYPCLAVIVQMGHDQKDAL
jgi:hypothetical protein